MGISYSINIPEGSFDSIEKDVTRAVNVIEKNVGNYKKDCDEHNAKLEAVVDGCKMLLIQRQMSHCNENRWLQKLGGTQKACEKFDLDLLECASDYAKLLARRH